MSNASVRAVPFVTSIQLVRPANTTAYAIGDIINSGPVISCDTTDTKVTIVPHTGSTFAGVFPGMAVTGTGIAASTKVVSVSPDFTSAVLDKAATASANNNITFTATATLPPLNFGGILSQFVEINSAIITSSQGGASTPLNAQIAFFKTGDMQADCSDNTAFAPTYAKVLANKTCRLDSISGLVKHGANCYEVFQSDVFRLAELGASGKLYMAILAANAYVPASGEILTVTVKGIYH